MSAGRYESPEELERRFLLAVLDAEAEFPDDSLNVSIDEWRARIVREDARPEDTDATVIAFPALRPAGTMQRLARAASTRDADLDADVSTLSADDDITVTASNVGSASALIVVEAPLGRARPFDVVIIEVTEADGAAQLHTAVLEPDGDLLVGSVTVSSSASELALACSAPLAVTGMPVDLLQRVLDEASDEAFDAWRAQVADLPAGHPTRVAVEAPTGR